MKPLIISSGLAIALAFAGQALAHDHLSHATEARGGSNPVGGNPSGVSGPASDPGSVPGGGDPNHGVDTGTPSVDRDSVDARKGRGND